MALRPLLLLTFLALVAQALAGCSSPGGAGDTPTETPSATQAPSTSPASTPSSDPEHPAGTVVATAPEYTPGDRWVLTTTIRSGPGSSALTYTSTNDRRVVALEPHTIPSGTYDAVRFLEEMAFSGAARAPATNTTTWYRASDGALLETLQDRVQPNPLGGSTHTRTQIVMAAPCEVYQWPLTMGAAWESHCAGTQRDLADDGRVTGERPYYFNQTHAVQGLERVTVPAGSYDAVRVAATSQSNASPPGAYTDWYAASACTQAKASSQGSGTTVDVVLDNVQCAQAPG